MNELIEKFNLAVPNFATFTVTLDVMDSLAPDKPSTKTLVVCATYPYAPNQTTP